MQRPAREGHGDDDKEEEEKDRTSGTIGECVSTDKLTNTPLTFYTSLPNHEDQKAVAAYAHNRISR
jgi:hypothetical protein